VTSFEPENVSHWSLSASILSELAETALATCTAVKCSGVAPNRFERRNRISVPPRDKCTIWRSVASWRSSALSALPDSTSCCDAAQEPTQNARGLLPSRQYAGPASPRRRVNNSDPLHKLPSGDSVGTILLWRLEICALLRRELIVRIDCRFDIFRCSNKILTPRVARCLRGTLLLRKRIDVLLTADEAQ
jgi:hypothetical protein